MQHSVVIFLTAEGDALPLMLQNVMGTPLLSHLASAMAERGTARFFVACRAAQIDRVKACFAKDADLTIAAEGEVADRLHVFLSSADEDEREVLLLTAPAMLAPASAAPNFDRAPLPSPAYAVKRLALMDAVDEKFSFNDLLREQGKACTDRDGWYAVSSAAELADWQPILAREILSRLAKNGVEIWDYHNCYVEPGVSVGSGTVLMPGTILRNGTTIGQNCVIGPNTLIDSCKIGNGTVVNASQLTGAVMGENVNVGPFAYVRPGTVVGDGCKVGDFVELKNSTLGEGTKVPHLIYVGDSDVGKRTNFGCGSITCNYDRREKHRTIIGDDCFIGCNTSLVAPVTVASGAYTAAGSTISDNVPPDALAVARSRQTNIPDWARTHKVKEKKK